MKRNWGQVELQSLEGGCSGYVWRFAGVKTHDFQKDANHFKNKVNETVDPVDDRNNVNMVVMIRALFITCCIQGFNQWV